MRVVTVEPEVFEFEGKNVVDRRVDPHRRQGAWCAGKLQPGLIEMVAVDVGVAEGVHEFAGLVAADLRQHQGQQRVGSDVERDAEEDVGAALIKLARQFAVGNVELEQAVAGR